jgi:hypothetical protein
VPSVFICEAFSDEYMTQVRAAVGTDYLCADPIRIENPLHRAWNLIIEAGPPAASLEFAFRTVKRRITLPAFVGATQPKIVVPAAERRLSALANDHFFFLFCQFVVPHLIHSAFCQYQGNVVTNSERSVTEYKSVAHATVPDHLIFAWARNIAPFFVNAKHAQ